MSTTIDARINALVELGTKIARSNNELEQIVSKAKVNNPWFTEQSTWHMLTAIRDNFLDQTRLKSWINRYDTSQMSADQTLAIVMAGNIPLVGFHDFLCGYILGYQLELKLSEKDNILLPYLIDELSLLDPNIQVTIVERLTKYDKVIATGSTNTSIYFEQYFGHVPNIIRKNRTSIAVLDDQLFDDDLLGLGNDLLMYFGLGCRNVSKIFLPKAMDIEVIFKSMKDHEEVAFHNKYMNNFDYSNALYLLNKEVVYSNGFLLARQAESLHSRISCVNYEYYEDIAQVEDYIKANHEQIQCVVSNMKITGFESIGFGEAQLPSLDQYADNIDTISFLLT